MVRCLVSRSCLNGESEATSVTNVIVAYFHTMAVVFCHLEGSSLHLGTILSFYAVAAPASPRWMSEGGPIAGILKWPWLMKALRSNWRYGFGYYDRHHCLPRLCTALYSKVKIPKLDDDTFGLLTMMILCLMSALKVVSYRHLTHTSPFSTCLSGSSIILMLVRGFVTVSSCQVKTGGDDRPQ